MYCLQFDNPGAIVTNFQSVRIYRPPPFSSNTVIYMRANGTTALAFGRVIVNVFVATTSHFEKAHLAKKNILTHLLMISETVAHLIRRRCHSPAAAAHLTRLADTCATSNRRNDITDRPRTSGEGGAS